MSFTSSLVRHKRIFEIHCINVVQFRLRALVWFILGLVNTGIVLLFWWATLQASGSTGDAPALPAITSYYLLMLMLATVVMCHLEDDIAYRDIQKGDLYGYLLQPYPYLLKKFQEEIVWRLLSGFWATVLILVVTIFGFRFAVSSDPAVWLLAVLAIVGGMLCSFFVKVSIGLTSIWLTNIRGLMDLYAIFEILFAGFLLPLALFPEPFREFALHTPLAVQVYFPVQILLGNLSSVELVKFFLLQIFYVILFFGLAKFLLHKGIRHYTGVSQ